MSFRQKACKGFRDPYLSRNCFGSRVPTRCTGCPGILYQTTARGVHSRSDKRLASSPINADAGQTSPITIVWERGTEFRTPKWATVIRSRVGGHPISFDLISIPSGCLPEQIFWICAFLIIFYLFILLLLVLLKGVN